MTAPIVAFLHGRSTLFWDFDGVIKDSVAVKSDAYERLFAPFGPDVAARVRDHHERNGGISRFEKLPLYLSWAGREASEAEVSSYCGQFSAVVRQSVIDSPWVPGAREYLQANHARQCLFLVTGTPQAEMEDILMALELTSCFREVHGAPTSKSDAIELVLARWNCPRTDSLLIGDSDSDYAAAGTAGVQFLLRRTALNRQLQRKHLGLQCEDFLHG
jgi:phosphoglycolate phosphatase-like HAD superfamily hydrolase